MRTHEHTVIEWVIKFDNGATHHERSYDKALQFAKEMGGTGIYGKPTAVTKHTRYVTSTYEDVFTF